MNSRRSASSRITISAAKPTRPWELECRSDEPRKIRELAEVDLAQGEFPGDGEVLAPASMRSAFKVGDGLTFVFKNADLIIDSLRFRVSGFFLPTSDTANMLFTTQAQFAELDGQRVGDHYYVFFHGRGGKAEFLSSDECKKDYQAFVGFLAKISGNPRPDRIGLLLREPALRPIQDPHRVFRAHHLDLPRRPRRGRGRDDRQRPFYHDSRQDADRRDFHGLRDDAPPGDTPPFVGDAHFFLYSLHARNHRRFRPRRPRVEPQVHRRQLDDRGHPRRQAQPHYRSRPLGRSSRPTSSARPYPSPLPRPRSPR